MKTCLTALAAVLLVTSFAACGGNPDETGTGENFIALTRDFEGFEQWQSFALDGGSVPAADGGVSDVHTGVSRTVYLNKKPASGQTAFPVGTVIVKQSDTGQIFAMTKRGGDYNSKGAPGWEWFELKRTDTQQLAIVWRGVGPPNGESYNQGTATCNDCHVGAVSNDYVKSPQLRLSAF